MMAAGMSSTANEVIEGMSANTTTWIRKMLKKVKGRPIASESQPQNKRPTPLKIEIVLTSSAAVAAVTPVNFTVNGEATEITAAPAVTFRARISQRTYHRGRRTASASVNSRTERLVCCFSEG